MVIFELTQHSDNFITYEYYPEGDKSKKPGTIELDTRSGDIHVLIPAEMERILSVSASQMNLLRDAMNEMQKEQGLPELTEDELPSASVDEEYYLYADHTIQKIAEAYNHGTILEKGTSMWY